MPDTSLNDTIKQLARLLTEYNKLEGKIQQAQSSLTSVKDELSQSLLDRYIKEGSMTVEEDLMKAEQSSERLLQALLNLKRNFEQQIRQLDEQIVQAHGEHVRQMFDQRTSRLNDCIARVDEKVLSCGDYIKEYKNLYTELDTLNQTLSEMGKEKLQLPERVPVDDFLEFITWRIQELKMKGSI